jgi:drug/metabolite transporter (DMT)-like permease
MRRIAPVAFLVLWSAGFSFVALGLPDSEPLTFLALRYAIVVALLAIAVAALRPPLPRRRRDWVDLAVVGLLLQAGYFALLYVALDLESSTGTIALIVSLQPILVALAAPRVASERVSATRWLGLAIGLTGAAVVIASRSSVSALSAGGLLCAVGALLALTASTLYESRFGSEHHPVTANAVQCGVALVLVLPPALVIEGFPVAWTADLAISLGYLVVANSLVSITLLLLMMRRDEASRVSALFFLVPPLAGAIAWAVLGESLPAPAWAGMVLAAVGVGIAATSGSSPRAGPPAALATPARRG